MELQLKKQWSSNQQHESEKQKHSPNMPKVIHQHTPPSVSALPLFLPKLSTLSPFSHSTLPAPTFPRMGSCFNFAQWQELELQALIFSYILAGAVVPPELLQPIKKSFLLQHYHPALLESGYWGRVELDPEPGRCRRTDGKKWRCSRDTVEGQKYCDRHMHRGRNRSRKHVEQSSPGIRKSLFDSHVHVDGDGKSDGHVLRHFFDDWPRTLQENDIGESNGNRNNSGTRLSISTPGITSSDVSLTLSTGHGEDRCHVASMGGPLAEALRSPSSTSSPTSVLLRPASLVPKS